MCSPSVRANIQAGLAVTLCSVIGVTNYVRSQYLAQKIESLQHDAMTCSAELAARCIGCSQAALEQISDYAACEIKRYISQLEWAESIGSYFSIACFGAAAVIATLAFSGVFTPPSPEK